MWWVYWDGIKCGGFIGMVLNVVGFIGMVLNVVGLLGWY